MFQTADKICSYWSYQHETAAAPIRLSCCPSPTAQGCAGTGGHWRGKPWTRFSCISLCGRGGTAAVSRAVCEMEIQQQSLAVPCLEMLLLMGEEPGIHPHCI